MIALAVEGGEGTQGVADRMDEASRDASSDVVRRVALRKVGARELFEAHMRSGWQWCPQDGEWEAIELRLAGAREASLERIESERLVLRTPGGAAILDGAALLEMAGGVTIDAAWPADVRLQVARLAASRIDVELMCALGGSLDAGWAAPDEIDPDERLSIQLVLTPADTTERHAFGLTASVDCVRQWLQGDDWLPLPPRHVPRLPEDLPFDARLPIGESTLDARALSNLRRGDAILIERLHAADGRAAVAHLSTASLCVEWSDHGSLTCHTLKAKQSMFNATDRMDDLEDSAPDLLDAVTVDLMFSAGGISLSLAELRELAAGSFLELNCPAQPRVDILANGRRIGHGELVDVNGRLAVEVQALAGAR